MHIQEGKKGRREENRTRTKKIRLLAEKKTKSNTENTASLTGKEG
jgi:hypothetical protein